MGEASEPLLKELLAKGNIAKARAFWLGLQIPAKSNEYIEMALNDENPKFRIQGIRMARLKGRKIWKNTCPDSVMINRPR